MALQLNMFDFLIKPIRDADAKEGNDFVKRFLQRPQEMWSDTHDRIQAVKTLWSVVDCEDEYLQFLKWIVGWTSEPELEAITSRLTDDQLRRLISISARLWKERGSEDTIADILKNLSGARVRVITWFDLRWIVGETEIGEGWEDFDSWFIGDEYTFQLRMVDNGTLDKVFVRQIVNLMRAMGETIEIAYVKFLDQFFVDNDSSQWARIVGSGAIPVLNGYMHLDNTSSAEAAEVNVPGADGWTVYSVTAKLASTVDGGSGAWLLGFYADGMTDGYRIVADIVNNQVQLIEVTSSTPTVLGTVDMLTLGVTLRLDFWNVVRAVVTPEGATNRIKVYIEAVEVFDVTDSNHSDGSVVVGHQSGADAKCEQVEVFDVPMDIDIVGPNYEE